MGSDLREGESFQNALKWMDKEDLDEPRDELFDYLMHLSDDALSSLGVCLLDVLYPLHMTHLQVVLDAFLYAIVCFYVHGAAGFSWPVGDDRRRCGLDAQGVA